MTAHRTPEPAAAWVEVSVTDEDWDAAGPELLTTTLPAGPLDDPLALASPDR
jgi:hypothetical protein